MLDALGIVLEAFLTPLEWFTSLLYHANALPIYLAMFLIGAVLRFFLRPIIGEAQREFSAEIKAAGRENYKKLRGGD